LISATNSASRAVEAASGLRVGVGVAVAVAVWVGIRVGVAAGEGDGVAAGEGDGVAVGSGIALGTILASPRDCDEATGVGNTALPGAASGAPQAASSALRISSGRPAL
jgi:hypothetical protein